MDGRKDGWTGKTIPYQLRTFVSPGEIDFTAFTGPVHYTRIRREWYYDVVMTDVDVEGTSVGVEESCQEFNMDKTIVDSGESFPFFMPN